jgi:Reverse transcriptase (RNA-dependent DNA polymerase)
MGKASRSKVTLAHVCRFENLLAAAAHAARGKRSKPAVAGFEYRLADELLSLQRVLLEGDYRPGAYTHFYIHDPKRRCISAAPFRDRVVHHAVCNLIEPEFDRRFLPDSYANRRGKGTHRAIDRLQQFARSYRYVLRLDVVKYFPAIDHEILLTDLHRVIADEGLRDLIARIVASGDRVLDQEYAPVLFPGDDLLALCRPRGLPIGNLTSQFWANCYLHPIDLFVKRELRIPAYLRYVDDLALFADRRQTLWAAKRALVERLAAVRLTLHADSAQVLPVAGGIPWLGLIVYPDHRRVKRRKVVAASRRLTARYDAWRRGEITFAEFDASVQGWIGHVRHADSWGLREHVLSRFDLSGRCPPKPPAREKTRRRAARAFRNQ